MKIKADEALIIGFGSGSRRDAFLIEEKHGMVEEVLGLTVSTGVQKLRNRLPDPKNYKEISIQ